MLGLPSDHPDVARLARAIYGTYARFAVEVMRLPGLPADEPVRLMHREGPVHERFMDLWRECQADGRGLIAVSGHIGSIEVFAGAYAREGIPTYGLADDSAFPELFELLNASRARWGVTIIPWKRLRDIFRVMRSPAVLGMVVDWGYRPDDLPVRLFGSWTTLPAGPATLAARTGAVIVPVVARRQADGTYRPVMYDPVEVADSSPAELARATQAIADALEQMIAERTRAVVHLQAHVAGDRGRGRGTRRSRRGGRGHRVRHGGPTWLTADPPVVPPSRHRTSPWHHR